MKGLPSYNYAIAELIAAATEMQEAFGGNSRDSKWVAEDGWGVEHRLSWVEDRRVRERFDKAIEVMKCWEFLRANQKVII